MKKTKYWTLYLTLLFGAFTDGFSVIHSFTSGEGFVDGPLNGQKSWAAMSWQVDTSDEVAISTTQWAKAAFTMPAFTLSPGGTSAVFRTEFHLLGSPVVPTVNAQAFSIGFSSVGGTTYTAGDVNQVVLMLSASGTFQLRNDGNSAGLIPAASTPIVGNESDRFAIEYYIALGTAAANSTMSARLINVTDGWESAWGSYAGLDVNVFNAAVTTGLFPFFSTATPSAGSSGVTGIAVDAVQVSVDVPPTLSLVIIH